MKLAAARGYGVAGCSEFTVDGELRAGTLGLVPLLWMESAADGQVPETLARDFRTY